MLSPTKKRRVSSSHGDQTVAAGAPAANAPAPPAVAVAAPNGAAGGGYQFAGDSIPHGRMSISPSKNPYRDTPTASDNYNIGKGASAEETPPNDCTMMMEVDEGDDDDAFDLSQAAEIAPVTAAMASMDIGGGGSSACPPASPPARVASHTPPCTAAPHR